MLLIHLSDIHFRRDEIATAQDPYLHIRNEILRDAEQMCEKIGQAPEAILISGDIAFAGDPLEYEFAIVWLEKLCEKCGTDIKSIFVVPGNHDVVRKTASGNLVKALHQSIKHADNLGIDGVIRNFLNDEEPAALLYKPLGNYNEFAGNFFCSLWPPNRTFAERRLELNDGSELRLLGLNSAFVSSELDKPGDLYVDPAAFNILKEKGVEKLVMSHHPYSWLRQGNELEAHLNVVARIQLFGHDHNNRILLGRDFVRVFASAAHPDRTEAGWEPGYNLLELNVSGTGDDRKLNVCAHVRVWQQNPGEFRAKTDQGREMFCNSIRIDAWTPPEIDSKQVKQTSSHHSDEISETSDSLGDEIMDSLREISIRFLRLSLSQKSAIAGKLNLFENEDVGVPDFERFRRVLIRAGNKDLIGTLDQEIRNIQS